MTTLQTKNGLRFGTWNVRTLYQVGKLAQVSRIMDQFKLQLMGLSEVRWNQNGRLITPKGHLMLWSGMPNENDPHQHGVGMLVNRTIRGAIMSYKFINERLMLMRIRGRARNITVIQCYAPTEDAETEIKEAFYDQLNNILAQTPKRDTKILMGDLNAKVGSNNESLEHIMGRHGVGDMNENGELLVELCGLNELKIGGTLFPHKTCHKVTWESPDSRTQNQIDHICVSAKWSNSLTDVRVKRSADIGSDHHLLIGHLKTNVKSRPNKNNCNRRKFNITKLQSATTKADFTTAVRERLAPINLEDYNIQQGWHLLKSAITTTAEEKLGTEKRVKEDFISPSTWALIDRRGELKEKVNAARNVEDRRTARAEYAALDRRVKREARNDKRESVNKLAQQAQDAAAANNMGELYNITKKIAGSSMHKNVPIKDANGDLLTNVEEQLKRWKEHFMNVLNLQRGGIQITRAANPKPLPIKTSPPNKSEIVDAIKSMKNGKAAGFDDITAEILKSDPQLFASSILPLFTKIWNQEEFPEDWMNGLIIKLPKKGDLTDCNNWRGITILCVVMKVFMKIILNRMVNVIDKLLRKEQAGFRSGKSCIDLINILRIIIEQAVEFRSPLYLLFIDYEKAFDSIDRECIWAELHNIGVPTKIVSIIRASYENFSCRVLHDGCTSEPFLTLSGVRQGCLLSPLLFLIVMDGVVRRATDGKTTGIVWDPLKPSIRLESLDYADDKCELSHRFIDMKRKLDSLDNESRKVGLKINTGKTKELRINQESSQQLMLEDKPIEKVSHFQYLGSIITENGGATEDVESRIKKARGAFTRLNKVWSSHVYHTDTKLNIFKSCVLSVLLYACETWLVTEDIKRKLQVFVNRCLRRILRIFWPQRITNEELWKRTEIGDINTEIRRRKFGWIGHTLRRDPNEISYRSLTYNPQGSRRRGRPRNTWRRSTLQEANSYLKSTNSREIDNILELKEVAVRRTRWRNFVDGLCSN